MSSCDEALDLISARLDGALSAGEEAALEAHLALCPACRALLADLEELHGVLPELWTEPPADLTDRVMDRIRTEPSAASTRRSVRRWKQWLSMVAVFAVILLGAGGLRWLSAGYLGAGSSGGAAPAAGAPAAPAGGQMEAVCSGNSVAPEVVADAPLEDLPGPDTVDGAAPLCIPASAPAPEPDTGAEATVTAKNPDGSRIAEAGNSADTGDTQATAAFALLCAEPELAGLVSAGPLPGQEETGLLLRRAEDAQGDTPAYAALLCVDAEGTEVHLHIWAEERAAWADQYAIWTVTRLEDGTAALQSEQAGDCALCVLPTILE